MNRIEVYEKYEVEPQDGHSSEYWREILPAGSAIPEPEYSYRRTMILVHTIERPIEIEGNKDEMILRMNWDEDMVIKANYDEFCIALNDIEEEQEIFIEDNEFCAPLNKKTRNQ